MPLALALALATGYSYGALALALALVIVTGAQPPSDRPPALSVRPSTGSVSSPSPRLRLDPFNTFSSHPSLAPWTTLEHC